MNKEIFERVRKTISDQLGVDESTITPEAYLQEDLNADPLSVADLIVALEEEFSLRVPNDQTVKFSKVEDIVNFIADQTGDL